MLDSKQNYQYALQEIVNGKYITGFDMIAEGFSKGNIDFELLEQLYNGFVEPNLMEMKEQFKQNEQFLQQYPYFFGKKLSEPTGLQDRFLLFPVTETIFYYFDTENKQFHKLEINSIVETKYFFKDISKPLFIENEFNEFNLKFLVDNVRDSIDFGGDNHIYLFFENEQIFSLLLYYCDLRKICEGQKIVFLIGEEKELYPLDAKQYFSVDYEGIQPTPIKLSEVKRVVSFLSFERHSGNAMIDSLLDYHDHLFTIKEFAISEFENFYEEGLKGRTVEQFINEFLADQGNKKYKTFLTFFNKIYKSSDAALPDFEEFIKALFWVLQDVRIPTAQQWFVSFFLANSMALQRDMNARMVPAIFHAPHIVWGCDWEAGVGYFKEFYKTFPYYKTFASLRRPESMIAGKIKYEFKCRKLYNLKVEEYFDMIIRECGPMLNLDWRRVYFGKEDFCPYEQMAILRYEDIKRYPKETLMALCEYLDIPWSDKLMTCTHNGVATIYNDEGTVINDFDLAPLAKDYYKDYLNVFDCFRLEVLYSKFYEPWGYEPRYYNGLHYSEEEIEKMMEIPFQFETLEQGINVIGRMEMKKQLKELLQYLKEWRIQIGQKEIIPCQWIKPIVENGVLRDK